MTYTKSFYISRVIPFFLLFGLCFSGGTHAAEKKLYKVELIVFSQNSRTSEVLNSASSDIEWPRNRVGLAGISPLSQRQPFAMLARSDLMLTTIETKLSHAENYQPLLHMGWVESVLANRLGKAIHISQDVDDGTIEGYVQLKRSHYLHYFTYLEYTRHDSGYDPMGERMFEDDVDEIEKVSGSKTYLIDEKRRIRLNEIHYFDHPRFGAIVKVELL